MKRLLPLALFLGFAASALPALAEEVKVLLDLPAPGAEETRWFPGGASWSWPTGSTPSGIHREPSTPLATIFVSPW